MKMKMEEEEEKQVGRVVFEELLKITYFLKEIVDVGNYDLNDQHKIKHPVCDKVVSNT